MTLQADGILIGASNGLSIAEGYNIFADDAWFQENMGDFREKYGLRCVLHGFSVPMKVEEKWAFVSRLVKAKAMQDEPSEIMGCRTTCGRYDCGYGRGDNGAG